MKIYFYELVCKAKQLCSDNHDRSRAIVDFFVLLLSKIYKDTASRVFYREERKRMVAPSFEIVTSCVSTQVLYGGSIKGSLGPLGLEKMLVDNIGVFYDICYSL